LTCAYVSWNDNICPVHDLHKEAARNEQGDVAVPGGDHLSGNNARPPVISRLDGIHPQRLRAPAGRLVPPRAGRPRHTPPDNSKKRGRARGHRQRPHGQLPDRRVRDAAFLARANPAVVAEFTAALMQAQAMSASRSVVQQAITTYISGMTPALVAAVQLDQYPTALSRARLQRVADMMLSAGLLTKSFNVSQLLSP
jgi:hypothetical protein